MSTLNVSPPAIQFPYGKQNIDQVDIDTVISALKGDLITQGPWVERFEESIKQVTQSQYAITVNSGTSALHTAMRAINLQPGEEVIVPAVTFLATANCVEYCQGITRIADVHQDNGLIDVRSVEKLVSKNTKALIVVDLTGQIALSEEIIELCKSKKIHLIQDAAHSLGATYQNLELGQLPSLLKILSFHPVKHITTAEGGAIITNNLQLAEKCRLVRSHHMQRDSAVLEQNPGPWWYEMAELGYNYRLNDLQAALGWSQMGKLSAFVEARRKIVSTYDELFKNHPIISIPTRYPDRVSSFHLYQILIDFQKIKQSRKEFMETLRQKGIGTQVHYIPLYHQPYYRNKYGYNPKDYPGAEAFYARTLSLPCYPNLTAQDLERIASEVLKLVEN